MERCLIMENIAQTFILHFTPWLDNLQSENAHRFIPALTQKDFYQNWDQHKELSTTASEIFKSLYIALPGGKIILLNDYLSQAKKGSGPSIYSIQREVELILLKNPTITIKELNNKLTSSIRSWNPDWSGWTISDVRAGEYLSNILK